MGRSYLTVPRKVTAAQWLEEHLLHSIACTQTLTDSQDMSSKLTLQRIEARMLKMEKQIELGLGLLCSTPYPYPDCTCCQHRAKRWTKATMAAGVHPSSTLRNWPVEQANQAERWRRLQVARKKATTPAASSARRWRRRASRLARGI